MIRHRPISSCFRSQAYLDHFRFVLEDRAGQGRLATIIERVGIGTMLEQELHQLRMAMIGSEHELQRSVSASAI
jgi:hypothetical protein